MRTAERHELRRHYSVPARVRSGGSDGPRRARPRRSAHGKGRCDLFSSLGLCRQTQDFLNSPNEPDFPSTPPAGRDLHLPYRVPFFCAGHPLRRRDPPSSWRRRYRRLRGSGTLFRSRRRPVHTAAGSMATRAFTWRSARCAPATDHGKVTQSQESDSYHIIGFNPMADP
jgi:hypothetical protein